MRPSTQTGDEERLGVANAPNTSGKKAKVGVASFSHLQCIREGSNVSKPYVGNVAVRPGELKFRVDRTHGDRSVALWRDLLLKIARG